VLRTADVLPGYSPRDEAETYGKEVGAGYSPPAASR